jgi:hypothetical protein
MKSFVKMTGLASILALGALAVGSTVPVSGLQAAQPSHAVHEGQGVVTELGANASAVTYWISAADGWHVVTTVDTVADGDGAAERHAVVRFTSVLQPGQSQVISVPAALGDTSPSLRIQRAAEGIEVTRLSD